MPPVETQPKDKVKEFWNTNPLFTGESTAEVGTKEWFKEHEQVYYNDCLPLGVHFTACWRRLQQGQKVCAPIVGCSKGRIHHL